MPPKHWPNSINYSRKSILVKGKPFASQFYDTLGRLLDAEKLCDHPHRISDVIENKRVYPHLQIQVLRNQSAFCSHPLANKKTKKGYIQRGVFATQDILAETELGEYVGEMHIIRIDQLASMDKKEYPISEYGWMIPVCHFYFFTNSQNMANELAMINDYRGLAEKPNVKAGWIAHRGSLYFAYVTIEKISAGKELLVNYGSTYFL